MSDEFAVTVHHGPYVLLVASGRASLVDLRGLIDLAADVTRQAQCTRALVDMMSVQYVHGDQDDRALGAHAAKALKHVSRIGVAVCHTFRQESGAQVARESGLELRTFDSLVDASEWIASDASAARWA